MKTTNEAYPAWTCRYSNEDFDRAQALANRLTAEDRASGREAPAVGYSAARMDEARGIVRAAQQ